MALGLQAQTAEFETAAEAVKNMKVGVNLGNTLESVSGELNNMWIEANTERRPQDYETAWGNPVTKAELMKMWRIIYMTDFAKRHYVVLTNRTQRAMR